MKLLFCLLMTVSTQVGAETFAEYLYANVRSTISDREAYAQRMRNARNPIFVDVEVSHSMGKPTTNRGIKTCAGGRYGVYYCYVDNNEPVDKSHL